MRNRESRRQKKMASLLQEALSAHPPRGTAVVHGLARLRDPGRSPGRPPVGPGPSERLRPGRPRRRSWAISSNRTGAIRRRLASVVELKYNPQTIFRDRSVGRRGRTDRPDPGRDRTMTTKPIDDIARKIRDCRRLAITSHLRPDGDSLCTGLALAEALESPGQNGRLRHHRSDPRPRSTSSRTAPASGSGRSASTGYDAVILLECADVSRSGQTRTGRLFQDQHRPSLLQRPLRRHQLGRRRGLGRRRNGPRPLRNRRRRPDAPDRRPPLLRHRLGHRIVPVLQHDGPGLRRLPQARRWPGPIPSKSAKRSFTTTARRR